MIVKNESKVILRLLESVLPIIDGYCICDTGSTDNTVELITTFFEKHGIAGKIVHQPFVDFGFNRSFAYKACDEMSQMDYVLLMDADMILTGNALKYPAKFKQMLKADVYDILQGSATYSYKNVRIAKNHKPYSYWGVTHEYFSTPSNTSHDQIAKDELFINDIGDGGAKTDKFERDIRLLRKGLQDVPNNDRYTFYLANSLRDAGHPEESIEMFRKRIEIGGWREEIWQSYYNIGKIYENLGKYDEAIMAWLDAYQCHPERLESLHKIIEFYRVRGKNQLAYSFYALADTMRKAFAMEAQKGNYLFMENDVWDYKLDYELSIVGYYVNYNHYPLKKICMKVLASPHSTSLHSSIYRNYKFYAGKWKDECDVSHKYILPSNMNLLLYATQNPDANEFVSSTPSIALCNNELIVNVRYVNYRVDSNGNYINKDHITTINVVTRIQMNTEWQLHSTAILEYNRELDTNNVYQGIEDIRLFESNGKLFFNGNRGLGMHHIAVENGEIDIENCKCVSSRILKKQHSSNNIEKNWVMIPSNNPLYPFMIIYNYFPHLSIGYIDDSTNEYIEMVKHPVPAFFRDVRGSSNGVRVKNEIWFFTHLVSYEDRRYYYHLLVALDAHTLKIRRYSPLFTFEKEKVEYTLGFVHFQKENVILIGYSTNDNCTKYMTVNCDSIEFIVA